MEKKIVICSLLIIGSLIASQSPFAQEEKELSEGISITVYNQNFGVVKERRTLELKEGVNDVYFQDVAAGIDPTSVHFKSLTDREGTIVLEQNYEYDLVSREKLLEKYIDKEIALDPDPERGWTERKQGILLSKDRYGTIVKIGKEIYINPPARIVLPALPEGLITRPTLVWKLSARKPGKHLTKVTYITNNINWKVDYTLVARENDTIVDLSGWVTIDNKSGATYKNAKIKLIAGDVHKVEERFQGVQQRVRYKGRGREEPFAEYHLYKLDKPTTVKDRQVKQIGLLNKSDIKSKKTYVYDGASFKQYRRYDIQDRRYGTEMNKKVYVTLEFKNSKDNNLGIPLPMGKVRVYKRDEADKSLAFIGEDNIDHTPKDEKVELYVGDAFDIVGERIQTDFKLDKRNNECWESFKITLRNHKEEDVQIRVVEHLYRWVQWEIQKRSDDYTKADARTIEFLAAVPNDAEKVIEYTVHYTW